MGKAQKLKQQRKLEEEVRRQEERAGVWRRMVIITAAVVTLAVTVGLILLVNYMKKREEEEGAAPQVTAELVLETSAGEIVVGLYGEDAPLTVRHVSELAQRGFYDGLLWYRVEDFVAQTGSHFFSLMAEAGEEEADEERASQAWAEDQEVGVVLDELGHSNLRGAVGMAKPSDPSTGEPQANSATTDFYILKADATHLDAHFTVFGRVISGMDVLDSLQAVDVLLTARVRER